MKRMAAFFLYLIGTPVCIAPAIAALADFGWSLDGLWLILMNIAVGIVMWWIVAGIGIRLGVFPIDFFRSIGRSLGLGYDSPVPGAKRVPERPTADR